MALSEHIKKLNYAIYDTLIFKKNMNISVKWKNYFIFQQPVSIKTRNKFGKDE